MINRSFRALLTTFGHNFSKNKPKSTSFLKNLGNKQKGKLDQDANTHTQDQKPAELTSKKAKNPKQHNDRKQEPKHEQNSQTRFFSKDHYQQLVNQMKQKNQSEYRANLTKNRQEGRATFLKSLEDNTFWDSIFSNLDSEKITECIVQSHLFIDHSFQRFTAEFIEKFLPSKPNKDHLKYIREAASLIVSRYIQNQDNEGLLSFFKKLQSVSSNLHLTQAQLVSHIEILAESPQSLAKYRIIKHLAGLISKKVEQPEEISLILAKLFNKFLNSPNSDQSQYQLIIQDIIVKLAENKKFNQLIFEQKMFIPIIISVFGRCQSYKISYGKFFELVSRANISSDKIDSFLTAFVTELGNSLLLTTQCADKAFPINQQFLNEFNNRILAGNNAFGMLLVTDICLFNNYITIPQQILQNKEYSEALSKIPVPALKKLDVRYQLQIIKHHIRNDNHDKAKQLAASLSSDKDEGLSLRLAIAAKDYDTAMSLFNSTLFERECIKKERLVCKYVLNRLFYEQFEHHNAEQMPGEVEMYIDEYLNSEPDEYFLESFMKREDMGYLMEDFYIKEPENSEADSAQKQEQRFSYWDKYFAVKRAQEINKFEVMGKLPFIKEPNPKAYMPNEFNLNEYISPENYQKYRELADYENKTHMELLLYLFKVEEAVLNLKATGDMKAAQKMITFQDELGEENLKILEDFGLKDYDISVHDVDQFENRLRNFKKFKGVMKFKDHFQVYEDKDFEDIQLMRKIYEKEKEEQQLQRKMRKQARRKQRRLAKGQGQAAEGEANSQTAAETPTEEVQAEDKPAEQTVEAEAAEAPAEGAESAAEGEETLAVDRGEGQNQEAQQNGVEADEVAVAKRHVSEYDKELPTDFEDAEQVPIKKFVSRVFLDRLRVKNLSLFEQASHSVKLDPILRVNDLIRWGLVYKQPMAVYMGEKLASITGQMIPHNLAIRVSDYFTHIREIDDKHFVDCKTCLTYIGKIDREFIYDDSKIYHHINQKPYFNKLLVNLNPHLKHRLEYLGEVSRSRRQTSVEPRIIMEKAIKGPLF